jgi:hypothetical protein
MPISLTTGGQRDARSPEAATAARVVPPLPLTLVLEGAAQPVMSNKEASQACCACRPIGVVIVRADYTACVAAQRPALVVVDIPPVCTWTDVASRRPRMPVEGASFGHDAAPNRTGPAERGPRQGA